MKRIYEKLRITRSVLIAMLLGIFLLAAPMVQAQDAVGPTAAVTSNLPDYPPGSTAIITGTGFGVATDEGIIDEEVVIYIDHIYWDGPDHVDEYYTVTTKNGSFVFEYPVGLDESDEYFYLKATGQTSGKWGECNFTDATLTIGNNALSAANICAGALNAPIHSFTVTGGSSGGNVTNLNFNTSGTYVASDLVNFKLYVTSVNTFSTSTLLATISSPAAAGVQTFPAFSYSIGNVTRYFWITIDVASSPVNGHTIAVGSTTSSTLTGSPAPTGSGSASGTQTLVSGITIANAGPDQQVCGTSATLAGNSVGFGETGTWSIQGGSGSITNINSPTSSVTGLSAGVYTLTWTISNGTCSNYDQVVLNVSNLPTADIVVSGTNPINPGDASSVQFREGPPNGYVTYKINDGSTTEVQLNGGGIFNLGTGPLFTTTTYTLVSVRYASEPYCSNSIGKTVTVTVTGCTAPTFTACPGNVITSTSADDTGDCDVAVSYTATATGTTTINYNYAFTGATNGSGSGTGSGSLFNTGTTTVTITATNGCGTATCTFTVKVNDTEKPTISCSGPVTVSNDPGLCSAVVTLTVPTVGDNCGVSSTVSNHPSTTYPVGTTVVEWTVNDIHGNTNTCTQSVTVNDTQKPTISCGAPVTVSNDAGICSAVVVLTPPTVGDNCGVSSTINDHPSTTFLVGTTVVEWTVTDVHGNTNTCTQSVTVNDTEKPTISCSGPVTVSNDPGLCSAVVTLTAPTVGDNCGVSSTVSNHPSTTYPVGTTVVEWTVTDNHGNTNTCTQSVTVNDTEKPTISCSGPVTVSNDPGLCSVVVVLIEPTVGDNCGVSSTINDHPSTTFLVGTTVVEWTVTDVHGNTNTCTQSVTVNDTESPTITCPVNITTPTDPGSCYATLDLGDPTGVGDNCGVSSTINDHPSASFPFGTTTVTWTVTDIHGNSATCEQIVTVNQVTTAVAVTVTPTSQQYSDKVTFNATITTCTGAGTVSGTVEFFVGTQSMGTVPVQSDGTATLANVPLLEDPTYPSNGQMAPGDHIVTAVYSGYGSYLGGTGTTTLTITCEDATVTYNGDTYFTVNPNNLTGTVLLSVYVVDNNDGEDTRGDIRNAEISFTDAGARILGTADVGLVDQTNIHEGNAAVAFNATLNSNQVTAGGITYEVWSSSGGTQTVVASNTDESYYCGSSEPVVVTLAMPGLDYVTGGGYIKMTNTSGKYQGMNNANKRMNFGLVMKWNKSGKNLQGNVNIIYRGADGFNYQIKSNAINSLAIKTDGNYKVATITTKANFKRLLGDGASTDLGGNHSLVITAWDLTTDNTGKFDRISVQLIPSSGSGILFSSNWTGGSTTWQTLDGGQIQIQMANKSAEILPVGPVVDKFDLKVYPNPFSDRLKFQFVSPKDVQARIDVYDLTGRNVRTVFNSPVEAGVTYDAEFTPVAPAGSMYIYRMTLGEEVFNGKVLYQK